MPSPSRKAVPMSVPTARLDDEAASRNASEQVYGNIGIKDTELINARLSELGKGAVVVNLGCGPSLDHLHALVRSWSTSIRLDARVR